MEDIIEKLREQAESVPVPLDLPDEDDLVEIEEMLLIPLPDDYKLFLLEVSDIVFGSLEPATVADPSMHTYLPELASRAWESGISRELIPFCETFSETGEAYYCLTLQNRVIKCEPYEEISEDEEHSWGSIWDWAENVWLNS